MNIGLINMEMHGGMRAYHYNFKKMLTENGFTINSEILVYHNSKSFYIENINNIFKIFLPHSKRFFYYLFPERIDKIVNEIIFNNKRNIEKWIITWDSYFLNKLNFNDKIYLVIHDVFPHEDKVGLIKKYSRNLIFKRNLEKRIHSYNLITNSEFQKHILKKMFPKKSIFYLPMLSSVTIDIMNGNDEVEEVKEIDNYILFFGRIEYYKGIHNLLKAFKNIDTNLNLVIAGKGKIYFKLNDKRVILVNRFINDTEIKYLFSKSLFVVFPYISATQVGPLSLAYYFGKPVIVPALNAFLENFDFLHPAGLVIAPNDEISLTYALNYMINNNNKLKYFSTNSLRCYNLFYNVRKINLDFLK